MAAEAIQRLMESTVKILETMASDAAPIEVIQLILKEVPYSDMKSCILVNKSWNAVATLILWSQVSVVVRPSAAGPLMTALRLRTLDITNFVQTKFLTVDFELHGDNPDDYPKTFEEIDEWIFNFRLLRRHFASMDPATRILDRYSCGT